MIGLRPAIQDLGGYLRLGPRRWLRDVLLLSKPFVAWYGSGVIFDAVKALIHSGLSWAHFFGAIAQGLPAGPNVPPFGGSSVNIGATVALAGITWAEITARRSRTGIIYRYSWYLSVLAILVNTALLLFGQISLHIIQQGVMFVAGLGVLLAALAAVAFFVVRFVTWRRQWQRRHRELLDAVTLAPRFDLDEPSGQRQRELEQAYKKNIARGYVPYRNVEIRTLGELLWVLLARGWAGGIVAGAPGVTAPAWFEKPRREQVAEIARRQQEQENTGKRSELPTELEPADLRETNLKGAVLKGVDLCEADLRGATLVGTDLTYTGLSGTLLTEADLTGAICLAGDSEAKRWLDDKYTENKSARNPPYSGVALRTRAELLYIMQRNYWSGEQGLDKKRADLRGADLRELDLNGADIIGADLTDAILIDAGEEERLRQAFKNNTSASNPPYADVVITKRQQVLWIIRERGWVADTDAQHDLQHINLVGANLANAQLCGENLRGAQLDRAKLIGANLYHCDFTAATLQAADLTDAHLSRAVLIGTSFDGAHLENADLRATDLSGTSLRNAFLSIATLQDANLSDALCQGADFRRADLRGAALIGIKVDADTTLSDNFLDKYTRLTDIGWGTEVKLDEVRWDHARKLGDEEYARQLRRQGQPRNELVKGLRAAVRSYRNLQIALHIRGLGNAAAGYHIREERMRRWLLRIKHERYGSWQLSWLFSLALDVVAGYGEVPQKTALLYAIIIFIFAFVYAGMGHHAHVLLSREELGEVAGWLRFSLLSFHGIGFFVHSTNIEDTSKYIPLLSDVEGLVGIFIQFIFIAAFTRRFLGS